LTQDVPGQAWTGELGSPSCPQCHSDDADLDLDQQHSNEKDDLNDDISNGDISSALLRSKADGPPPLSSDGQVVLKITRMARSQDTHDALFTSPELAHCRSRVADAECELQPAWAGGATCFVPFTEGQLADLSLAGEELEPHHIVALRSDMDAIKAAFAQVSSKRRPRVDGDSHFHDFYCSAQQPAGENEDEADIIVEETWPSTSSSLVFGQIAGTMENLELQ